MACIFSSNRRTGLFSGISCDYRKLQSSMTVNFAIVLGTVASGSGAVFDFLRHTDAFEVPLDGREYYLPHSPYGLTNLVAHSDEAFHLSSSDQALKDFRRVCKVLSRSETPFRYGLDYANKLPGFDQAIDTFVDEITVSRMPMRLMWRRLGRSKIWDRLRSTIPGARPENAPVDIVDVRHEVTRAAKRMHEKVFRSDPVRNPTLLNQAGSGWNPEASLDLFERSRIVVVTRDPRDQFAQMKLSGKATDVVSFVAWYRALEERLKSAKHADILRINFEDFVLNFRSYSQEVLAHFSMDPLLVSSYSPDESKSNLSIYVDSLSNTEKNTIEQALGGHLYSFS